MVYGAWCQVCWRPGQLCSASNKVVPVSCKVVQKKSARVIGGQGSFALQATHQQIHQSTNKGIEERGVYVWKSIRQGHHSTCWDKMKGHQPICWEATDKVIKAARE
eukprot:1161405-Pelagomonas_calceolata.AAC.6